MSGPTGYETGGARTLLKPIVYENDGVVSPGDYPAPDNVFGSVRQEEGVPDSQPVVLFNTYTLVNSETNTTYTVIQPLWGGNPVVYGNAPTRNNSVAQ